jgi:hypothetical protein
LATIEKLTTGPIPSAVVRTEAGRTRQVRTIDLEPVAAAPSSAPQAQQAAPAGSAEPASAGGPDASEG